MSELHCDTFLALDELGELAPEEAGQVAYMLANGQGKGRADKAGDALQMKSWRLMFLSTGEVGLADKLAENRAARRRKTGGEEVRFIEIPADVGTGFGVFEDLHEFTKPQELAEHLSRASALLYGQASLEYLKRLTDDLEAA
jgi:putative DNA primase/helicase